MLLEELFIMIVLYYRNAKKNLDMEVGYNSLDSMAEFFMFEKNYEEAKKSWMD